MAAKSHLIYLGALALGGCLSSNEISDPAEEDGGVMGTTTTGFGAGGSTSAGPGGSPGTGPSGSTVGGPSGSTGAGPSGSNDGGATSTSSASSTGGPTTTGSTSGAGGAGTTTSSESSSTDGPGGSPQSGATTTGATMVPEVDYCAPTADWDPAWAQLEQEIVELVNQYRAEGATCGDETFGPAGPLTMDSSLQCAARMHSLDMAERDFFSHDNPSGEGPNDRMKKAGYSGRGWGENIAGGNSTAEATMVQWMDSPGHCSNIMSPNYTLIGVGYYPGGEWGHLWTQTFGG